MVARLHRARIGLQQGRGRGDARRVLRLDDRRTHAGRGRCAPYTRRTAHAWRVRAIDGVYSRGLLRTSRHGARGMRYDGLGGKLPLADDVGTRGRPIPARRRVDVCAVGGFGE